MIAALCMAKSVEKRDKRILRDAKKRNQPKGDWTGKEVVSIKEIIGTQLVINL